MEMITLTTDFGTADSYVGQMKGVILGMAPEARIVDLSHDVPAQDILAGALALDWAIDAFPAGTVHLAVVDPGVGSDRNAIAIRTMHHFLVGPDNGLFTAVLARQPLIEAVRLSNGTYHRHPTSRTFHGRDIFSPVAAHLANGVSMSHLGDPLTDLNRLDLRQPIRNDSGLKLHVIHVDHFGNLITDLTADHYQKWRATDQEPGKQIVIRIGDHRITKISGTFSDAPPGNLVAYFGSSHRLEIAVRNGNASECLGARRGTTVELYTDQA